MFGRNTLASVVHHSTDGSTLSVKEVFHTIQGEGPFAGMPAVFVRLAGCNLRCVWCDTDFDNGVDVHTFNLINQIRDMSVNHSLKVTTLVVITGGEPLRQNIYPLTSALITLGYSVQIETAGTTMPRELPSEVHIVCSPKTQVVHADIELRCKDWKYIVAADDASDEDGLPHFPTQPTQKGNRKVFRGKGTIWVQPRFDYLESYDVRKLVPDTESNARNVEHAVHIAMRYNYRLSLQIHKQLNLP
jgi:organic radical activating enzyme